MIKRVSIEIASSRQCKEPGTIDFSLVEPYSICLSHARFGKLSFDGPDLFECLIGLRSELAKHGYRVLCNGSRKDVFLSQMSRQMSGGRRLYLLNHGRHPSINDLVDIFDPADFDETGTVDEQTAYFASWLESLK